MIWLSWRQQRLETVMIAGLLALVAASLVPLGLHMASVYSDTGVGACLAHTAANPGACGSIVGDFQQRFEHAGPIIPWLNFLPGLFGVLFAAPLVLDLEHGTFRLAWTQSVTRRRWLTTRLAWIYAWGLAAATGMTVLLTWWREPLDRLAGRMEPNVFDFEGIVPYAYTLFALSLVIALGVFTRRVLVAATGGLLAYFALRISVQMWARPHYLAPIKRVWAAGATGPNDLDRAWKILSGPGDAHGRALPFVQQQLYHCMGRPSKQATGSCLRAHHIFNVAVYQPESRFWLFQGIEFAIFAGLAVALLGAAVWWLRNRVG
jgi:hypothetical protein